MITRRSFFGISGAGVLTLFVVGIDGAPKAIAAPAAPGGTLVATKIKKYRTPLLVPPAMPLAPAQPDGADYYEVSVRQFAQQILPAPWPATTVWGYGPSAGGIFNAPSLTIEATLHQPVRVKWTNELVDASGVPLPHLLPVDPTIHWANPNALGAGGSRDSTPDLTGKTYLPTLLPTDPVGPNQYTRYWGPVPLVTHVHGAVGVHDDSDGYPEAWYLPAGADSTYTEGSWYDHFKDQFDDTHGVEWEPGSATFQYPNGFRAATMWYHDHTLGMTRLNVYAGPAGFFILRDGDADITDAGTGAQAVLPGPAPQRDDAAGTVYRDIPLAIQDRAFNNDGSLFYPDTRAFFDGVAAANYIPAGAVPPIWNPEFFGNTIIVNGNTWPFLDVEQRRYRFRMLNGCQSRFLIASFASMRGVQVHQIGNEGGLLPTPVNLTTLNNGQVLLGPAERADLIVDFTAVKVGDYELNNLGPDTPFQGGRFQAASPASTGRIMMFRVRAATSVDDTTPAQNLVLPAVPAVGGTPTTRRLALLEHMDPLLGVPIAAMLGTVEGDPIAAPAVAMHHMWADPIAVNPEVDSTEIWEFYNTTMDAHPMHVHEVAFEVVDRQPIIVVPGMPGPTTVQITPGSVPVPPQPWELGRKETVIAYPGQVTRVKAKFEVPGTYVWHCHIVEHEDNEMMLSYRIGPDTLTGRLANHSLEP